MNNSKIKVIYGNINEICEKNGYNKAELMKKAGIDNDEVTVFDISDASNTEMREFLEKTIVLETILDLLTESYEADEIDVETYEATTKVIMDAMKKAA